jgi:hypothetical protein
MVSELMPKTTLKSLLAFLRRSHQHRERNSTGATQQLELICPSPSLEKPFIHPEHAEFGVEAGRLAIH